MTIKRGLDEPIITEYQRLVESLPMVVNLGELDFAYLRPHGRSEGRVRRIRIRDTGQLWQVFNMHGVATFSYDTRAQAAQAANPKGIPE